jgi:hypothetical protein
MVINPKIQTRSVLKELFARQGKGSSKAGGLCPVCIIFQPQVLESREFKQSHTLDLKNTWSMQAVVLGP